MNPNRFVGDQVIGILVLLSSLCGLIVGVMVALGLGVLGIAGGMTASTAGPLAGIAVAGGSFLAGFVILCIVGLNAAIGVGIMQSKRWGLMLGAICYGIGIFCGSDDKSHMSALFGIVVCVYCILRLVGQIGPK